MGNNRGGVEVAYNVQSAVDGKHDLILDYHVSQNPSDQNQLSYMVKRVKKLGLKRFAVVADKGCHDRADLARVKRYKVKAIVSRQKAPDRKDQPEMLHGDQFQYDAVQGVYRCPMGCILHPHNKKTAKRRNYFNKSACAACPHREFCTKGERPYRTLPRGQYSEIYEQADKLFCENLALYKRRQQIVKHPFGTVKRAMDGSCFLLRTRRKVRGEIALLFLGYDLKRALKVLGFQEIMARLFAFSFPVSSRAAFSLRASLQIFLPCASAA